MNSLSDSIGLTLIGPIKFLLAMLACLFGHQNVTAQSTSRLADAVELNDSSAIEQLLVEGAKLDHPQADGTTALHWAVEHDEQELVLRLIDAGVNVNATNRYGMTPLFLACTNGNTAIIEHLLRKGADVSAKLPGDETTLMTAARTGKLGPVKLLLDAGVDVNAKEARKQTAIMWAANEGHADVVEWLIESGADYKTPLKSGFTPFFFAVRQGHTNVVKTLLRRGIDVNDGMKVERRWGRGPKPDTSPLSLAVENGHFELAVFLLESGANPNDQRTGLAPLHRMVWVRKPDRGDGLDGTPPPIGSGNLDSLHFIRKLVEHGADVNLRLKRSPERLGRLNKKQATAFLMACKSADKPMMKLLLELKADPTIPNVDGSTPLMIAAGVATFAPGEEAGTEPEAIEAVRLLLELGLDINAVDKNGETAMHGAAYKGFPEMVRFLDANGADIEIWNKKNHKGWTPLLIAHGYRPGNFRPLDPVIQAVREVMIKRGVTPPENPKPTGKKKKGY